MNASNRSTQSGLLLIVSLIVGLLGLSCSETGQVPDDTFSYKIEHPAYPPGKGPTVLIDEAHGNFHTMSGRYKPFDELLRQDGYVVKALKTHLSHEVLGRNTILVSSVPTSQNNQSAFSDAEIEMLKDWMVSGFPAALLLITDHMPDPAAMANLAEAFGITLHNGYVLNDDPTESQGPIYFRRSDGTLGEHPITNGREGFDEQIDSVVTFTGCAIQTDDTFSPLMTFGPMKTIWMTKIPGEFPEDTPQYDVEGMYQGVAIDLGAGRMAFFGEAGMFTAQIIKGPEIKFGMNDPTAVDNPQFVLNIMHWLSRKI